MVYVPAGRAVRPCPFPCAVCRRAGRRTEAHEETPVTELTADHYPVEDRDLTIDTSPFGRD
ncbi:hypothetical protein GCM10010211_62540 [Streptomyces albospinus]|uniref:Uncharacterized protein n=1 Tax=Streptomyces albospinus TaxID=285515 RepID=A0ABQ2VIU3_9ACTN|nr:hypothetical protein GCM10010211_62540 [Streptomyces albospinus]